MTASLSQVQIRLAHATRLYLGGRWVEARQGGRIEVVSPASEAVVAVVAEATEEDVDAAVAAAREAFDHGPWPRLSPLERAQRLRSLSVALEARLPELAKAWVEQTGALASVAPDVVGAGRDWFDHYAGLAACFPFEEARRPFDG